MSTINRYSSPISTSPESTLVVKFTTICPGSSGSIGGCSILPPVFPPVLSPVLPPVLPPVPLLVPPVPLLPPALPPEPPEPSGISLQRNKKVAVIFLSLR